MYNPTNTHTHTWEDPLTTQPDREIELSKNNREVGACAWELYLASRQSSRAPSTHTVGKSSYKISKPLKVCVCVFIKLHITAQSGPVILVILCHSH